MAVGNGLYSLIPPKGSKRKTDLTQKTPRKIIKEPKKESVDKNAVLEIEIGQIKKNPHQPRKQFDKEALSELANSIKRHGIVQPLIVTKIGQGYQLIAGERRLEAAKLSGLKKVPVIVRDSTEQQKLEIALIENIQRDDLNPIEKAYAFKKLIKDFNLTQEEVAKKVGKNRTTIANTLRLLDLPAEIQRAIFDKRLTEGHGRAILTLSDKEKQLFLYKEILKTKMTTREAERLAKRLQEGKKPLPRGRKRKNIYFKELEENLANKLGTKVKITGQKQKGKLVIDFYSKEELDALVKKLQSD